MIPHKWDFKSHISSKEIAKYISAKELLLLQQIRKDLQKQGGNTAAEKMKSLAIFSDVCLMTTATLMKWTQTVKPVG